MLPSVTYRTDFEAVMLRALRNKYPEGSKLLWVCGDDVPLGPCRDPRPWLEFLRLAGLQLSSLDESAYPKCFAYSYQYITKEEALEE